MTYYKIQDETGLIGVGTSESLRKHQKKHNILLFASGEDAECIDVNGTLYRDKWFQPMKSDLYPCMDAKVIAINQEEYDILSEALKEGKTIDEAVPNEVDISNESIVETPENEYEQITAEYVRSVKLKELSAECARTISSGFDLTLSGEMLHFSMTANDQLNLNSASVQILNGESEIPYHPDGGDFRIFSSDEMVQIINAANAHKTYQLAYFNSLKKWVNALSRISSIQAVTYGSEIPKKYVSSFLKSLEEDA